MTNVFDQQGNPPPNKRSQLPYRSYSVGQLAQIYYPYISPKSATRSLSRYIAVDTDLLGKLLAVGYHKGIRILTPAMVALIVQSMGSPAEFLQLTH